MIPPFQALVYPLTVAKKSSVPARERAAQMILKNMREHSETLVQQEFMVGAGLASLYQTLNKLTLDQTCL